MIRPQRVWRVLLGWYANHRRDLPWRRTHDPYEILVSEFMLQQTQVERVIPYYQRFLERFPTMRALARARLGSVLRAWSGLGYNVRARRLWESARAVIARGGALPPDEAQLRRLPGVGRYTAAAVASFAFGERAIPVDTNVARVLARIFRGGNTLDPAGIRRLAADVLPARAAEWSQALMDVGALYCRATPNCAACPALRVCLCSGRSLDRPTKQVPQAVGRAKARPLHSAKSNKRAGFIGSKRYYRGRIVRALARNGGLTPARLGRQVKEGFDQTDLPWLQKLLRELERDGLVVLDRGRVRLP